MVLVHPDRNNMWIICRTVTIFARSGLICGFMDSKVFTPSPLYKQTLPPTKQEGKSQSCSTAPHNSIRMPAGYMSEWHQRQRAEDHRSDASRSSPVRTHVCYTVGRSSCPAMNHIYAGRPRRSISLPWGKTVVE
jgi:hypothetical protein